MERKRKKHVNPTYDDIMQRVFGKTAEERMKPLRDMVDRWVQQHAQRVDLGPKQYGCGYDSVRENASDSSGGSGTEDVGEPEATVSG